MNAIIQDVKVADATWQYALALGDDCATAHQLRRMTGVCQLGVLDWVYTPTNALQQLIATDFAGFFNRDNLQIRQNGDGVIDVTNGVVFHHDFSRHPELGITPKIFAVEFDKVAARYRHLIERWQMLRDETSPLLFARATRGADTSFSETYEILRQRFRSTDVSLLFFRRGLPSGCCEHNRVVVFDVLQDAGLAPEYWRGNDANWDAAMAAIHRFAQRH